MMLTAQTRASCNFESTPSVAILADAHQVGFGFNSWAVLLRCSWRILLAS